MITRWNGNGGERLDGEGQGKGERRSRPRGASRWEPGSVNSIGRQASPQIPEIKASRDRPNAACVAFTARWRSKPRNRKKKNRNIAQKKENKTNVTEIVLRGDKTRNEADFQESQKEKKRKGNKRGKT